MDRSDIVIKNFMKADSGIIDHSDPAKVRAINQIAAIWRELNFKPPCECYRCLRQYRTLDQQELIPFCYFGSEKDAAALAESYTRSIESDGVFLLQNISEFGISILNRWNAGVGRRKGFLEKAKPDLYPNRNPLIDIPSRVEQLRHQREYRMGYMLPYLNVDDLSRDPTKLIGLLLHRTNCLPEEWVPFDHAMLRSGWKQCTLTEKSTDGCITMHGDHFGKWSTFDPIAVHRNDACGAPRALMILESQQILMKFLRDLTTVILGGAKPSKSTKVPANVMSTPPASIFTVPCHPKICTEWLHFLNADQKKDQPWLSFGAMFSNQPFSAAPTFDIDAMIDLAENQANEAQDEIWLLQTDLEYFHDRSRYYEATWFDKIEKGSYRQKTTARQKFDNIGFIMTVKAVIQARDWQWLLDECQNVKRELQRSGSAVGPGKPLPEGYQRALGSLEIMLGQCLAYHQSNLKGFLLRSPAFSKVFKVTGTAQQQYFGLAFKIELRDYTNLYRDDRIGWCLYQLASNFDEQHIFEPSAVLQYLNDFLDDCPRKDHERIDQEMQRCISELAAITRMMKLLDLHRPSFPLPGPGILEETRPAWQVLNKLIQEPVPMLTVDMGLGSLIKPLNKFRMPTGRKDEKWLARRDMAHSALRDLWAKAREAYQASLKRRGTPQECIDPQLEWMKQADSPDNKAQLDLEREQILDRLQAARQRALAKSTIPYRDTTAGFVTQPDRPAHRTQEPAKEKTKTRPDTPSASATLHANYAAAFANLVIDEEMNEAEKLPPVLYTLKRNSMAFRVLSLMFPDRSKGTEEGEKTTDWLDFVSMMSTLGFTAEHRGGSAFAFKGAVKLPSDPSTLQKRSIGVHRPHPITEMGPVLLRSLGRRFNRRFGWQRSDFAADEDFGQGTE